MLEIQFNKVSFAFGDIILCENVSFKIRGICNLILDCDEHLSRCFKNLLSFRTEEKARVIGDICVNGSKVADSHFDLLLCQHRIFDSNERVCDILSFINRSRAEEVLAAIEPDFSGSLVSQLTIEESRIFEIIVAIVANPPLVFLASMEICFSMRQRCIRALRRFLPNSAVLILSGFNRSYDGTVVVLASDIVSYGKKESKALYREFYLRQFLLEEPRSREGYSSLRDAYQGVIDTKFKGMSSDTENPPILTKNSPPFDCYAYYAKYGCSRLARNRGRPMKFVTRLPIFDVYRICIGQAFQLAYRKYCLMMNYYNGKTHLYRNICPLIISLLILRLYQEMDKANLFDYFICYGCALFQMGTFSLDQFYLILVLLVFKYLISGERLPLGGILQVFSNLFWGKLHVLQAQLFTAALYLTIFYSNCSIIEEDYPLLVFYVNTLMTPGTYIASIFIYIMFLQGIILAGLGFVLGTGSLIHTLVNAFLINIAFGTIRTKRLRELSIGMFIAVNIMIPFLFLSYETRQIFQIAQRILFPLTKYCDDAVEISLGLVDNIIVVFLYCIAYVFCCSRISGFNS